MKKLILASTSVYRQKLLGRLGIDFKAEKPLFDEEKHKDLSLSPLKLAQKLAYLKAQSLQNRPDATIIGGDQLVGFQGQILGKPHTREAAIEQLLKMQGQKHELITAVCVIDPARTFEFTNITEIQLRKLSRNQIEKYVDLDQPLDCAGGYKIELHGIALMASLKTEDPTAIEGLPLIRLSKILQECGYENFSSAN